MSSFVGSSVPKKQKLAPVQVFLRIRPKHNGDGNSAIVYCTPKEIHMKGHLKGYTFDQIFDENTSQLKVYKSVVGKMISDVTKGYNCTIFAYGQTGTGKTHTIMGDSNTLNVLETSNWQEDSKAGIILRAAMHLYEELDNLDPNLQRMVTVSFMEIYNEEIRDLLCDTELIPLRIYEDKMKSVHVKNLQEVTVLNPTDIIHLLKKGCERRQVASTLMNKHSSRSHTVFTISVSTMQTISDSKNITCGKLNLIDLAGSENSAKSGSKEQRAREATNINQSLLTLGRVIKALVENSPHVPYRESKLTRILQDSLGGKAKTTIIATVSPGMASLDETMNTLDYAQNARSITNCPTINLRTSDSAAAVQEELLRLKRDLFAMANEQGVYMDKDNYNEMTQSLTQCKKEIATKHETIKSLTERVGDLEAQKHEWDNLKESFMRTSQAYQRMKTEMEQKEEELLRDGELLEYYKSESSKFKEISDLLFSRGNFLHKKLDHVYQSSSKNLHLIENIINRIDDLFLPQNSQSLSNNVSALLQFNEKVSHMISNVANQLKENSRRAEPTENLDDRTSDNYNRTILGDIFESTEYLINKFQLFAETCSTKAEELRDFMEQNSEYIIKIKNAWQEEQDGKLKFKALLKVDDEKHQSFEEKFEKEVSKQNTSVLEHIEKRKASIEREEERIKKLEEMLENHNLQKEIVEYGKERTFKNLANLPYLKRNAHQAIELITSKTIQNIESSNLNADEIQSCILYMGEEMSKVLEHVLKDYQKQRSEMANVLQQISHIHSIQGHAHIEMVNESLCTTGEELKKDVKNMYESSAIPIAHAGDTPQPMERIRNTLSDRNSLVQNLFSKSIAEDHPESQ